MLPQASHRASGDVAARSTGRRRRWVDSLTSLWSPVLLFLSGFVLYVACVQLWPQSVHWALPVMRAVAITALVSLPALAFLRGRVPGFVAARHLRIEGREVAREVRAVAQAQPELLRDADALEQAVDDGSAEDVRTRTAELVRRTHEAGLEKPMRGVVLGALAKTLLVALLIRGALVEPYRIPTASMLPTLQVGDQVLVNRFVYGVQIPFTQWVPFPFVRRPGRGDVIVFDAPVTDSEVFIKRVVGLPGDEVELREGILHLNGSAQPQQRVDEQAIARELRGDRWVETRATLAEETLEGREHAILLRRSPERQRTEGPWKVPEGHVFVMGDDRDASSDSRYGFGKSRTVAFVPYGNIKGKAMVIWLSLSYEGTFSNLFGGTGFRADRMFLPVR